MIVNPYIAFDVQYEVEYDDVDSDNGIFIVYARNEDEARHIFDSSYSHSLLDEYDNPTAITANAAWPH